MCDFWLSLFLFSATFNTALILAEPLQRAAPCRQCCQGSGAKTQQGLKSAVLGMNVVGCHLCHLLVRQKLKPGEVLLGGIAAFLHTSSLLRPVRGEGVRHTAARLIFEDGAGTRSELRKRHVKCYFCLRFYPSFTGKMQPFWYPGDFSLTGPSVTRPMGPRQSRDLPTLIPLPRTLTRDIVSAPEAPAGQSTYQGWDKRKVIG